MHLHCRALFWWHDVCVSDCFAWEWAKHCARVWSVIFYFSIAASLGMRPRNALSGFGRETRSKTTWVLKIQITNARTTVHTIWHAGDSLDQHFFSGIGHKTLSVKKPVLWSWECVPFALVPAIYGTYVLYFGNMHDIPEISTRRRNDSSAQNIFSAHVCWSMIIPRNCKLDFSIGWHIKEQPDIKKRLLEMHSAYLTAIKT